MKWQNGNALWNFVFEPVHSSYFIIIIIIIDNKAHQFDTRVNKAKAIALVAFFGRTVALTSCTIFRVTII